MKLPQPGQMSDSTAPGRRRGRRGSVAPQTSIGRQTIASMRRSPIPAFALSTFESAVLGRSYLLGRRGAIEDTRFIEAAYLTSGRLWDFLAVLMEALPQGYVVAQMRWALEDVVWENPQTQEVVTFRDAHVVQRLDALEHEQIRGFLLEERGDVAAVRYGSLPEVETIPASQLVIVTWKGRYGSLCGESIFAAAVESWEDERNVREDHMRSIHSGAGGGKWINRIPPVIGPDGTIDEAATKERAEVMTDVSLNLESNDQATLLSTVIPGTDKFAWDTHNVMPEDRTDLFVAGRSVSSNDELLAMGIAGGAVGTGPDSGVGSRTARDSTLLPQLALIELTMTSAINRQVFAPTIYANRGAGVVSPQLRPPPPSRDRMRLLQETFNRIAHTAVATTDGREMSPVQQVDAGALIDQLDLPLRDPESLEPTQPGSIGQQGRPAVPPGSRDDDSRDDDEKEQP